MTTAPQPTSAEVTESDLYTLFKRRMLADPWYFSKYVCGHGTRAIERIHRPLLYLYTRKAALLAACLADPRFDGYFTDQIKADFKAQGIDWLNPAHLPKIQRRLRRVNIRLPRGGGKSVMADDGNLYEGVCDPDITISIGSKADPFVQDRMLAIGAVVRSPQFAYWFPERVPLDLKTECTQNSILLAGRKVTNTLEATIEGRGITSQWAGRHYEVNRRDDIVGTESGEASLEDALKHLADLNALQNKVSWRGNTYIGTVTGANDDHSLLAEDPDVLSVTMPMEVHVGGTTLENVFDDGELTMPEWEGFAREGVDAIKREARTNPGHGPVYLLQNYYMVAHQQGSSLFTRRMLDKSLYRVLKDPQTLRQIILRPLKGNAAKCFKQWPKAHERPTARFNTNDWFVLDTTKLPYTAFGIAGDQSITEDRSGDEWAYGIVCVDWEGVFYVLDVVKGRGYNNFLDGLKPFVGRWPDHIKIGLDSNATQGMTVEWIKRSSEFESLARRVIGVKSGGEAKDVNIRNYVQARMLSDGLFINPELADYHTELLKYRPRYTDGRKRRSAVDNQLDVTWMAMTLPTRPLAPEDEDAIELGDMLAREAERKSTDPVTHVSFDSWMDAMDWTA